MSLAGFDWVLAGALFFGGLGGLFGALAGSLSWSSGRAAGTYFGLEVARAFARVGGRELSPAVTGALVGGTDGVLFLGVLGTGWGFWVAGNGSGSVPWLMWLPFCFLFLALGAVGFGLLAYGTLPGGSLAVVALFLGGLGGGVLGFWWSGLNGLMIGILAGVVLGVLLAYLRRSFF